MKDSSIGAVEAADGHDRLAAGQLERDSVLCADAATAARFADQARLTRWFRRCYRITPAEFSRAAA
jgi:AraC-like DNA-binding protein